MKPVRIAVVFWVALGYEIALGSEKGLVAPYNFDSGKGTTLHDRSGCGNDGTIHGASWAASGDGFALEFDGVDDYVDCGVSPSFAPAKAVSVEAWVYPKTTPGVGEPGVVGTQALLFRSIDSGTKIW